MLKTRVKASRVTNLTDARYFAAWEVEWVGFSQDPSSEYYVNPSDLIAMREWLTGPKIVGEFGMQETISIAETAALLNLDAIQLTGFEAPKLAQSLKEYSVITEIVIDQQTNPAWVVEQCQALAPFCENIILDFSKNDLSWQYLDDHAELQTHHLKVLCDQFPVLLSINCSAEDLPEMLTELNPQGLNLFGGEEEKVGVKTFDEIDEIFELLYEEG
ncbi:MAG: hypothetical protein AAF502_07995 [Bacteroidota bacterium]